jgi:hypothetical protein
VIEVVEFAPLYVVAVVNRVRISSRTVLSLLLVTSRAAWADADPETIRVIYQAPAACPSADAFVAEVRRATPWVRLDDDSARLFRVDIQAEPTARGRLTIIEKGALVGSRDVEGATCEEVSRVLAFAVALAIDSRANRPADPVAEPLVAPGPTPAPATVQPDASRPALLETPPTSSEAWWGLSVHASATSGVAPNATFGVGPSADFGRRVGSLTPILRVGLEYSSSAPASADGARVTFDTALLSLEGCPTSWELGRLSLRLCARFGAGTRIIAAEDIPNARRVARPWVDLGAMAHLRLGLAGPLFADLAGGTILPVVRDRVVLAPDVTVQSVPPFGGRGEIALGVSFR